VIWFGGREVVAGRLTAGDLIAFIFYMVLVVGPLVSLSNIYSQIQAALAAAERIFELLDLPTEAALNHSTLVEMPTASGQLTFEQVSFTYPAAPVEAGGQRRLGSLYDQECCEM
jgi:ABC-type bacteriocin/lantibiotic exporter with double-glycine peptidase domain